MPICSSQGFISCAIFLYKTSSSWKNGKITRYAFSCLTQRASSVQVNPKQLSAHGCSPLSTSPNALPPGNGRPKTWDMKRRCQENKRGKKGRHEDTGTPRLDQNQNLPSLISPAKQWWNQTLQRKMLLSPLKASNDFDSSSFLINSSSWVYASTNISTPGLLTYTKMNLFIFEQHTLAVSVCIRHQNYRDAFTFLTSVSNKALSFCSFSWDTLMRPLLADVLWRLGKLLQWFVNSDFESGNLWWGNNRS